MANSLTAFSPTYWSKRMGRKLYKSVVFRAIASFEEQAVLHDGQIVDRPYRADVTIENYVKGTALTAQDLTATSDTLTVNVIKALLMYVDNVDKIQNKYSAANVWADEAATRLAVGIDAVFLYEVTNANNNVDDSDVNPGTGTANAGFDLTTSNVLDMFTLANKELDADNVPLGQRNMVISPNVKAVLMKYLAGRESQLGDSSGQNGHIGSYMGFKLYLSNNLTASARWTPANNPSNNDTVTIEGITFTFVSSIGSTAGNILIGSTTADTIDNIVALIDNGGATSDSSVSNISLTAANQRAVQMWDAVDGTTYLEVRVKGGSFLTVSGSDASDVWGNQYKIQHVLAGRDGAIDAVIQQNPKVEMDSTVSAGKWGMNILPVTLFGVKTFNQGKNEIVNIKVKSANF